MKDLISEYEAAQLVKISPTLLRWFTSYDAKGDGRKLDFEDNAGVYFYEKKKLLDFNANLQSPWTKPPSGTRPNIPKGIQQEIKTEAYFTCPVCHTNVGEIAHIEPVCTTLNNHPHNLIFLCPNHHTVYDFGFKFKNIKKDDVKHFKDNLLLFQSIQWGLQSQVIESYLSVIFKINILKGLEEGILQSLDDKEFQKTLSLLVAKIDKIRDQKTTNTGIKKIIGSVDKTKFVTQKEIAYSYLTTKNDAQQLISSSPDFKPCPVCATKGCTDFFEICPGCDGEGYVPANNVIDITKYSIEDCPLCSGAGYTPEFETCPPCGGEGRLTREQIDTIDFDRFLKKDCPVCNGKGYTSDFETCPPCDGEGKLTNEQIDHIDFDQYEFEDCPLCNGNGRTTHFDYCPPCDGEGRLTKQQISQINFDKYNLQFCPLCKGRGSTNDFEVCPPCDGVGSLTSQQIENIDFLMYTFKNCPTCKGKGYTEHQDVCQTCGGEARVTVQQIQNMT